MEELENTIKYLARDRDSVRKLAEERADRITTLNERIAEIMHERDMLQVCLIEVDDNLRQRGDEVTELFLGQSDKELFECAKRAMSKRKLFYQLQRTVFNSTSEDDTDI